MGKLTRESWIIMALAVAIVAAAVAFVYRPQGQKLEELRTKIASVETSLQADSQKAAVVPELLRQIEAMKRRYKDFDRKLPKTKELGGFLAEITNNLAEENLAEPTIEPRNPAAEELYHTLPIVMRCRGSYLAVASFLKRIDRMQRLTRVHTLRINKQKAEESLSIEMQLNIYYTES